MARARVAGQTRLCSPAAQQDLILTLLSRREDGPGAKKELEARRQPPSGGLTITKTVQLAVAILQTLEVVTKRVRARLTRRAEVSGVVQQHGPPTLRLGTPF